MKRKLFLSIAVLFLINMFIFGFIPGYAQTAPQLQAFHNAADPSMALADVTISVLGTPVLTLDSVAFRTALPMTGAIAGFPISVGISQTGGPVVLTYPVTLSNDHIYIGMVRGVINPAQFAANPDGRSTAVGVTLFDNARATSTTAGEVQFFMMNGVTDAPTVDLSMQGSTTLVDNLGYGDYSGYVSIAPAAYIFDLTDQTGTNLIGSFNVDLSAYADSAMVLFSSGFLDPSQNQNGAELGLFGAFRDGTVVEFPRNTTAISYNGGNSLPASFNLAQNYPNPFNPVTTIEFTIPEKNHVSLAIFNTLGEKVASLADDDFEAGNYKLKWDASRFPSGIYYYRMRAGSFSQTKYLILMK